MQTRVNSPHLERRPTEAPTYDSSRVGSDPRDKQKSNHTTQSRPLSIVVLPVIVSITSVTGPNQRCAGA
jgi:hypothetical protein